MLSLTFDFEPLYLNISSDASEWGKTYATDINNYNIYSRGIFYAPDSFSAEWGMGFYYGSGGKLGYGKLNKKTYYWYNGYDSRAQFNETNNTYYWFCLER